jgi:hypothetical protein
MVGAIIGISRGRHSTICQGALPDMPQPADFGGFYYTTRLQICWHIMLWRPRYANGRLNHCANGKCRWIRSRVVAKSTGSIKNQLYIDGCVTLWPVALRHPIFKQKKRSMTFSLGLNYNSMVLYQLQSRDTVSLSIGLVVYFSQSWNFVLKVHEMLPLVTAPNLYRTFGSELMWGS